jgi:hypothetical protein
MNNITTTISLDTISYLREMCDSIVSSYDYAYPYGKFDEDRGHVALSTIKAKVVTLKIFLRSLKNSSEEKESASGIHTDLFHSLCALNDTNKMTFEQCKDLDKRLLQTPQGLHLQECLAQYKLGERTLVELIQSFADVK